VRNFIAIIILTGATCFAQTDSRLVIDSFPEKSWGLTIDRPIYQAQSDVQGTNNTAQVFWWDSIGRFRLSTNADDVLHLGYRYVTMNFDTDSPLLPDHLDELSMAAAFPLRNDLFLVVGAGYSGNNPFADSQGVFGLAHLISQKKLNDTDDLILSLDFDGISAFLPDIPLPGVAWVHRDQDNRIQLGFPRSELTGLLTDNLSLDAAYAFPYTADVTLDYAISRHWHLYSSFSNFFNAFREDEQLLTHRLFYQMSRVEAGIRFVEPDFVLKGAYFDMGLAVGYAFEQHFYDGFDIRDLHSRVDLQDVPYVGLTIRGRF